MKKKFKWQNFFIVLTLMTFAIHSFEILFLGL